jgi:acetyltransferase
MRKHRLHKVFEPESVALVGASNRPLSVGGQLLAKLVDSDFPGKLYPVNPAHDKIEDLQCFATISEIGQAIDLVVIAIPAAAIPAIMRECGEQAVGAVIIISAGFSEVGAQGQALQNEIVNIARAHGIALVGPNCLGVIRPSIGLNASFAKSKVATGHVAMVAQSGAFCTALLDWGDSRGFGFSAVASLGAIADVGFGEVLDYLALDPLTKSILLYIESVSDARAFLSGLRAAARLKPVIVVKSGRSEQGYRAVISHIGTAAGGDLIFDAALRRAGAVRVISVGQLFATAQTLASGIRVEGSRLAILTNGGGPGVMAADRAADLKVPLADLSKQSLENLSAALPDHWSHSNPVDILGDACSERYRIATQTLLADENVDGILVLLSPQGMTDPAACAQGVIAAASGTRKPVLTCWLGENLVHEGRRNFTEAGIPSFNSPEAGVEAFGYLAAYRRSQNALLQAPPPLSRNTVPDVARANAIIDHAIKEQRFQLNDEEVAALLRAFEIPVSDDFQLPEPSNHTVQKANVKIAIARDPVFGPVISLGPSSSGEANINARIALPPLNNYLALELIQNAFYSASTEYGREPVGAEALVQILIGVSEIACELPTIQELDISLRLQEAEHTATVVSAHMAIATARTSTERYCHMAIHPYPPGLETTWQLADDTSVAVRPIRPEDATIEREFVDDLSAESKYFRFMNHMDKISSLLLARFTQIDYDREMALVVILGEHTAEASMIGVARYICHPDRRTCEFALTVADDWQKKGIGHRLMERLIAIAQERGVEVMEGDVLAQNSKMLRLCKSLGFHVTQDSEEPEVVILRRAL